MKNKFFTTILLIFFLGFQLNAQTIYEIYSAGGIAGGSWTQDYIILSGFTANQSLVGKSVQYRGSGTGWTSIDLTGNADATGFYRIWLASTATGAPWTPQQSSGAFNMTNTAGTTNCAQVALMNNLTVITASTCPSGVALLDLVGYIGTNGGTTCCYEGAGPAAVTNGTGTQSRRRTQEANNNSADFTIINNPYLPIELISFKATPVNNGNLLHWQTATEQNNRGFEVERSSDNIKWEVIHFEKGNGTSNLTHDYSFLDGKLLVGTTYYRLRQVDTDGGFDYSPIVSVEMKGAGNIRFFPNPARQGSASLFFSETQEADCVLDIFDAVGRMTHHQNIQLSGGDLSLPIDLSNYAPGLYSARLTMNNAVQTVRLLVAK
jgi:hypothetical protein